MSNFDKNDYDRRDRRPQDRPRTDYRRDNNDYRRDEHHQSQPPQQQSSNNYSTNASYRANDRYGLRYMQSMKTSPQPRKCNYVHN